MRTVQMTLEDDLIKKVDRAAKELKTTRSGFTRFALRTAIKNFHERQLEEKHRRGYKKQPVTRDEFDTWENEHAWGDE